MATDAAGNVYVADTNNHRIQKFTGGGAYITQWGSHGSGDGQFDAPLGIAIDTAGNVHVADANNNRIQKFGDALSDTKARGSSGGVSIDRRGSP